VILRPLPDGLPLDTTNLILHLKLDEGTGQTLTDSSGTGRHFQRGSTSDPNSEDPAWAGGPYLAFEVGDVCTQTSGAPLPTTGALTIALVFRESDQTTSRILFTGGNSGSYFRIATLAGGQARVATGATTLFDSTGGFDDGAWHSLVVTFTADGTSKPWAVYKDGSLDSSGSVSVASLSVSSIARLGTNGTTHFVGDQATVLVFDAVKSSGEVAALHAYLKGALASRGISLP
jgi:hypothetical protein